MFQLLQAVIDINPNQRLCFQQVKNPACFYSRKGFYALNVQVVCDKRKKVLYRCIRSRGAEHDSSAFKKSSLYELLSCNWKNLSERRRYLIGDSAYSLRLFIITPFDNAKHGTREDDFNYYHSSSRICIECTFGEIDMRWGILWKPLGFALRNSIQIIDACFRLHNFIVDYREDNLQTTRLQQLEKVVFEDDYNNFLVSHPDISNYGIMDGHDELQQRGRPTVDERASRKVGLEIRNEIVSEVKKNNYTRPKPNWYRNNNRFYT